MKTFNYNTENWLSEKAFQIASNYYDVNWAKIDHMTSGDMRDFAQIQNSLLLMRLFIEQTAVSFDIGKQTLQIIDRDFGGLENFKTTLNNEAMREGTQWIVLGLSFADFKFHLFPITSQGETMPFSVSPMASFCFIDYIIEASGLSKSEYINSAFSLNNWKVVESRVNCLSEPLDIFGEFVDCSEGECNTDNI